MSHQIKMLILTSNEDVIRHFSSNKIPDTYIIHLNDDKPILINEDDRNVIRSLPFLEQLTEPNSVVDQVYKRALDSKVDESPSKIVKMSNKSSDSICAVCGGNALGFNYDVLTCGSCKVFFRRNANQNLDKMICVTGNGQCSVNHGAPHRCRKCRLERCFTMGMRKDFILSDEQKQRRKQRLELNRNLATRVSATTPTADEIDQFLMDIEKKTEEEILVENSDFNEGQTDNCIRALQVDDRSIIENVHLSFLTIFNASPSQVTDILDLSDRTSALITYSQFVDNIALRFINFFRQIEQFERLNVDDRLVLIKYNIFPLVMTLKCFHYNPASDCCSPGTNDEAMKHRQFFLLCNQPMSLRDALVNMVLSLVEVTKQDPILISLLLIILIFSRGLSMSENEPILNDYLSVYQAQSFYTKILWNYLLNQTNETQAIQRWTQLITMIFRIQSVAEQMRQFIHRQCLNTTSVDKIAPIMQSVMHIY